jgi:hypothetical protein
MSRKFEGKIPCSNCKRVFVASLYSSVNVTVNPELKEKVFNEEIKNVICPYCRHKTKVNNKLLYHDMDNCFALEYNPFKTNDSSTNKEKDGILESYIFNAPVINEWSEFLSEIILFENRIKLTPKNQRLKKLKQRKNIGTFEEQVKDIIYDLQLNVKRCKYCGSDLFLYGLEENCTKCKKSVREKSPYILELAIEIIITFFKNFNDLHLNKTDKIEILINSLENITNTFYMFKKIENEELSNAKKYLNDINKLGVIYPPLFYIEIKNNHISYTVNSEQEEIDSTKIGKFENILYIIKSLDYLFFYTD